MALGDEDEVAGVDEFVPARVELAERIEPGLQIPEEAIVPAIDGVDARTKPGVEGPDLDVGRALGRTASWTASSSQSISVLLIAWKGSSSDLTTSTFSCDIDWIVTREDVDRRLANLIER